MAEPLDVDARLAEGRPAVENVGDYVWACHLLGYQNPDLTLHAAQVRDWYASEDGLDLGALEADRAALESVATAADGARHLQERQLDTLSDAWRGLGGDAAREFLLRHGEASAAAASAVRNAVGALSALRDDLWHAVDEKVASAVAIEDRRQGERAQWQAATQTVSTGAGDRAVASELIDQQVKPFVDNDIRSDWLGAMQKAMAAVAAAFDAATGALTGDLPANFDVPGDLGPSPLSSSPAGSPGAVDVAGTAPAGWSTSAPSVSPASSPMTSPAFLATPEPVPAAPISAAPTAAPAASAPTSAMPSMPSMPSLGELGGGLPGGAGGLAGLGSQFADAIGGLLNGSDDALPDPPDLHDEALDPGDPAPGDDEDPEAESDEEADDLAETDEQSGEPVDEPVDACAEDEPVEEPPPPDPAPTPPPAPVPPPEPVVDPPPAADGLGAQTPCEIAADELPQAGP
jgi:hypothetical protein